MTPILLALLTFAASHASAATPREELKTLTSLLQKSPSDDALRGKIIALAKKIKPAPAVPEEARRALIRGNTAFAAAKDPAGYSRAIERFEEASVLAPWWAEPYFNLAKACEGAQDFERALRALKYYGATATTEADKRQGLDLTYALEEKRDLNKADSASASNAAAVMARAESSIEGAWWRTFPDGSSMLEFTVVRGGDGFDVKQNSLNSRITGIRATETTLRYTHSAFDTTATYDLHREGNLLIGTQTVVIQGNTHVAPMQLFRKP